MLSGLGNFCFMARHLRLNCMGVVSAALRDTIREYYIKVTNNEALGGLPADNGWVLRGLQNDTMGLHEFLAMNISRGAGWWAPRTQYIEVCCADKDPVHTQQEMLWSGTASACYGTTHVCSATFKRHFCDNGCTNLTRLH